MTRAAPDTATNITAFNGKPVGGHPVILLHVYSADLGVDAVQVLVGKLFKISGKYGWKLDVTVPPLPFGTATTIFDVTVQHKPWVTRKTVRRHGRKVTVKTKHYYVSAKCSHGKWFYKGTFHYTSNAGPAEVGLPARLELAELLGQVAVRVERVKRCTEKGGLRAALLFAVVLDRFSRRPRGMGLDSFGREEAP